MTEIPDTPKSWRVVAWELEDKLSEFKRFRADPNLGMQHELPMLADLAEKTAEVVQRIVVALMELDR